jgi:hypothetical protein
VRSAVVLLAVVLVGTACGVPGSSAKQADEIASIAAEGELLAHDAAEGETFRAFTRVHARALAERLQQLQPEVADERIGSLLARALRLLDELAAAPEDRQGAVRIERELASTGDAAENVAR